MPPILAKLALRARAARSPEEGELRQPGHVSALPGPYEGSIPRSRACAHADVVLLIRLEAAAAEQVQPIEPGQPLTRQVLAFHRLRVLEPAVRPQRHAVAARQVVELDAGAD